jgi:glutamate 5-kinase
VEGKKSLLAVGVRAISGSFGAGDVVDIADESSEVFARGIVTLSAADAALVRGQPTPFLETILGRVTADEIVHRDDLAVGLVGRPFDPAHDPESVEG